MTEIRSYTDTDFPDVKSILSETGLFVSEVDKRDRFRQKIEDNPGSIKVAELEGKTVGIIFATDDATNVLLTRLAVLPEYQGQGIGTELLDAAENWLEEQGSEISVVFAEEDNEELKAWYEDQGYENKGSYSMMMKDL